MLWRRGGGSDACQRFYLPKSSGDADGRFSAQVGISVRDDATVWEERSSLWLPGREVNSSMLSWPQGRNVTRFQRAMTYEDVSVPLNPAPYRFDGWCMPYFIRTPVRAVKIDVAAVGTVITMHPAIWKVASTTISHLMGKPPFSRHRGPHDSLGPCLTGWNRSTAVHDGGCHKLTSANLQGLNPRATALDPVSAVASMDELMKFAFVRDPFERFAAGVHEHGMWNGAKMDRNVNAARGFSRNFARFPHDYRNCPLPTQSYFLSATDDSGKPIDWDFIAKLEDFDAQWISLGAVVGSNFSKPQEMANPSGSGGLTRRVVDALRQDLEIACRVCQVYIQDYVCLGYTVPEYCCARKCAEVHIDIPDDLLTAAC
ncbi:unnamed protein product [Prorocentrum cordatum]|uniref:Uncharacterized protein n=1 Tax=Prorocentrum cordatum TaxID=2364126 RepID=A0ABN9VW75_9DINO|nr:unnamed protein product [Polarella glacialis]